MDISPEREKIFISYSHDNAKWLEKLRKHLNHLSKHAQIEYWSDKNIVPGTSFHDEMKQAMEVTRIAVLLVTPEYLDSEFICDEALPYFVEMFQKQEIDIFWIPISASSYQLSQLKDIPSIHTPKEPLDTLTQPRLDEILTRMVKNITKIMSTL